MTRSNVPIPGQFCRYRRRPVQALFCIANPISCRNAPMCASVHRRLSFLSERVMLARQAPSGRHRCRHAPAPIAERNRAPRFGQEVHPQVAVRSVSSLRFPCMRAPWFDWRFGTNRFVPTRQPQPGAQAGGARSPDCCREYSLRFMARYSACSISCNCCG